MQLRTKRIFANIIIVFMLFGLALVSFTSAYVTETSGETANKPIYRGNGTDDSVSLMINVYWGTEFIGEMLDTLKQFNAHSTFFVGGTWAQDNKELLRRMVDEGHEIGNHGYFHKDQNKLDYAKNLQEIETCHVTVRSLIGVEMNLFAPPSGAFNNHTLSAAKELGYRTIMWSRDTIDWRDKDAELTYSRATKDVKAGDLILMHPTAHTAKALPRILQHYRSVKLCARTVSMTL